MANLSPQSAAPPPDPAAWRPLYLTTLVAAVVCGLTLVALLVVHLRSRIEDPLRSPQLMALKQQLLEQPKNETLKLQIRQLDLELREDYARQLTRNRVGAWILAAGVVLLVLSAKAVAKLRVTLPSPQPSPDAAERAARNARKARHLSTGLAGATAIAVLLVPVSSDRTRLPSSPQDLDKLMAKLRGEGGDVPDLPSAAEFAANWPRFLGPTGNAFVSNATLPLKFDLSSGDGLLWKTPVPAAGFNSPIIWSNRVFLSGGDATNRSVFCFDLASGATVWQRTVANVPGSPAQAPEIPDSTGFAASSLATDGRRVYAMFANGDLAAFALDGSPAWSKNLGVPHNAYGHATSLATWQGRLIVQLDQGEPDENLSKLIAFDGASGRVVWQKPRPVGASWATPAVADAAGKPQIVTLGGELVIAYHANDGAELWRAELIGGEITPSPIFAGGLALIPSPSDTLYAIRPDGSGDVTKSHVAWKTEENIPDVTSPVSNGELVFTVLSHGVVTCHDLKDGAKLWEHEADTEVNATPAVFGERLYILGAKGLVLIIEAAREPKELAKFDIGEGMFASPAFAQGIMVVRTTKTLFAVGAAPQATEAVQAKVP